MRVYVVLSTYDTGDDSSFPVCKGVYSTWDKALEHCTGYDNSGRPAKAELGEWTEYGYRIKNGPEYIWETEIDE